MLPTPVVPIFVVSLISTIWIDTSAVPSRDVKPQQDRWCRVTSLSESVGPLGTRKHRYLGRVTSLDDGMLELRDVVEDEWTIHSTNSLMPVPPKFAALRF